MAETLTDKLIRNAKPSPDGKRRQLYDSNITGLTLRIYPNGNKFFYFNYWLDGRFLKLSIGRYGDSLSLAQARHKAGKARTLVQEGIDPRSDPAFKSRSSSAATDSNSSHFTPTGEALEGTILPPEAMLTYREAFDKFEVNYLNAKNKPSSREETKRILLNYAREWHGRHLATITDDEVNDKIEYLIEQGKLSMARHLWVAYNTFFKWCVRKKHILTNPARDVDKPPQGKGRDRVLKPHEIQAIFKAARKVGYPFGTLVEILLSTGQRRNEVAHMRWSEIDLEKRLWIIPGRRTKNGQDNIVPLTPRLIALLQSVPDNGGDLLFPGDVSIDKPMNGFSKRKKRFNLECGFDDWYLHDFRRAVATHMAEELDVRDEIIETLLNHVNSKPGDKVKKTYNHAKYIPQLRDALTSWHAYLRKVAVQATRPVEQNAEMSNTGKPTRAAFRRTSRSVPSSGLAKAA